MAVQNYIDNTGVQVADVVIAFQHMEKKSLAEVKATGQGRALRLPVLGFVRKSDAIFCRGKQRAQKLRGETLKAIEAGHGETAEMGAVIADAIVGYHLRTMARMEIYYELLARESEILHLHFWDAAFEKLKASGAIQYATTGKNAGCWIMPWKDEAKSEVTTEGIEKHRECGEDEGEEESRAKIIVRSNGTVTYVGKDIAYQLWKFGLLGKDFYYRRWPDVPGGHVLWATTAGENEPGAPHFGGASAVYNVIDARQGVFAGGGGGGVARPGVCEEAEHSIHFDYQIVALTPRCAAEMGYELSEEDAKRPYVEVSGRKGYGVKADDLITRMQKRRVAGE